MSCLNVWMNFLVWQWYNMLNTFPGIIHHSPPPLIRLLYLPPSLCAAGVQREALWKEVRVVPDWLVRRQLVQDQRPSYQLYSGEHDGGCGGTCDHGDCHAESWDCPRRLQHGGNSWNTVIIVLKKRCLSLITGAGHFAQIRPDNNTCLVEKTFTIQGTVAFNEPLVTSNRLLNFGDSYMSHMARNEL